MRKTQIISAFIELTVNTIYGPLCKNAKKKLERKSLNVSNVKLLSKFFFNVFGFFGDL